MPRYQYECNACNESFEQRQSFNDDPLADCPLCGAEDAVERVITSVGVIFKGSGFYINDSKNNNGTKSTAKSSTDNKSETKPVEKAETKTAESVKSEAKAAE